jgi:hypothetical protein
MSDDISFNFDTLEDCLDNEHPKSWILENAIARGETSSWYGRPGSLKSALWVDIGVHVASGRDWRGYKFPHCGDLAADARGVIYFALERADLTKRRLIAHVFRDGLPSNLPFAVISEPLDLLDPSCVDRVINAVEEFERRTGSTIALIVIDTYSKAIARGDEDKAQTQNIAAANIQRIHDRLYGSIHIATIGHTGKNPAAGERGSNAKLGHVDMSVQISGDKVRTATVVKANDQSEGPLASFELEEVTIRRESYTLTNRHGEETVHHPEPWTVGILAAATPVREARTDASRPPSGKHAQVLDALVRAITERGKDGAVHADYWKEELARAGLLNLNAKNPRSAFKKLRDAVTQHLIDVGDGIVRIKNEIAPYASPVPTSPS